MVFKTEGAFKVTANEVDDILVPCEGIEKHA